MFQSIHEAFHAPEKTTYKVLATLINILIVLSVLLFLVEMSLDEISPSIRILDQSILIIFIVEISLRLISWEPPELRVFAHSFSQKLHAHLWGRLRFMLQPLNLIDIITVLTVLPWLRAFRALRLLRLLRSFSFFNFSRPLEGIERSFRDDKLLFISAFGLLTGGALTGGIIIFFIEANQNPNINTVGDGIWWALVTLTTVGFGDISPVTGAGRIVGGVLMISGMFMLALFAGIISQTLLQNVLSIREEQFRMSDYLDHLIICGYDPGVQLLFDALMAEKIVQKTSEIVIFAPGERPHEIPENFVWVPGDPTKESELGKVRLAYASAIIIVGSRTCDPQDADAKTILTAFTIRSHLRKQAITTRRKESVYVIAEILDSENVEHAKTAGADEVIETTRLGFTLIAHAVHMPGSAHIIDQVATANSTSLFVGPILSYKSESPLTFNEVCQRVKQDFDALVIGVKSESSNPDLINPPADTLVPSGSALIYIAEQQVNPTS
jgi:voltage-gated potassium channel